MLLLCWFVRAFGGVCASKVGSNDNRTETTNESHTSCLLAGSDTIRWRELLLVVGCFRGGASATIR